MADGPIDYSAAFAPQTPIQSLAQGYQLGAGIRDDIAQQNALQQQAEAAKRQQEAIGALLRNPNAGAEEYANAISLFPGAKETLTKTFELKNTAQKESQARDDGQVFAALRAGKKDIAMQFLQRRADIGEQSGNMSPQEVQQLRTQAQIIEADPNYARALIGQSLAATEQGRKILDAAAGIAKEEREQAQAPAELLKKQAEAQKAGVEAEFAPQKYAADIGLTKAQTSQALAQTEKLGAEIQKLALDAAGGGELDPEKKFDFEQKLRKEHAAQTTGFQDTREAYNRIKSIEYKPGDKEGNGIADIALIYSYMKMLDPGSVVREGEFATASNSGGVPATIQNLYNKALNGSLLNDSQRNTFKARAQGLLDAAGKREKEVRGGIERVVKSYKLNPSNVFYDGERQAEDKPVAGGLPPSLANKGWARY